MKRHILITIGALLLGLAAQAQSPYSFRYWYDQDCANATTMAFGGGNWQAQLDVDSLAPGLHFVHFSVADATQRWNPAKSYLFLKPEVIDVGNLVYHCWFDQDIEHQVVESFSGGSILMDVSELSDGLHTLHFLLEGSAYTTTKSYLFMKVPTNPDGDLHYRCWFNQDLATVQTGEVGSGVFQLEVSALPVGQHSVTVQLDNGNLSSPRSYAFFRSPIITVMANPIEGGTATVEANNNACTLTATPNEIYDFVNWTVNGNAVSTQAVYNFTATEDATYVANFALKTYDITATANPEESGTVTGAGVYHHFDTCTLTATANTGYHFVNWTHVGEVVSNSPIYSFEVTEAGDYVANFELNSYEITATANPTEGGTVAGAGTYNHFETCTLTATANTGYHFVSWTHVGEVVSNSPTYSFEVTEARDYVANFELNSYEITATANPTAGGTVAGAGVYQHFSTCTLTATANTGYHFLNWTHVGEVVSNSPTYSFEVTEAGDYVANFELNSYEITVTANPTEGGTVTGAGTYGHGTTATLTATANLGYAFVNWTENGVEVSTSPDYGFTVTGSRNLVANFTIAYHWDMNVSIYPNTMTMVGVIVIDGEEQMTTTLEIGAFCGDECRGHERLVDTYYQAFGHYFVFLTVYGNDGDQISFRLYDHLLGEEPDLTCSSVAFQTNGILGNPGVPYVFDFGPSQITQLTNITSGWNWWSTYIEADDLFAQLKTGLGANAIQIKSSTTFVSYFNGMWVGGLSSINNESCYLINANNACTVEMTGNPAAPADHPITINPNWNWIGYPNTGAQSVANAFSNFTPANGDQVKSQNAFATYYGGMWVGGLSTITPGMGLLYKSNSAETKTLIYSEANRSEDLAENVTNEDNHWTADYHAYPGNMTVMAVIELDDVELQGENYEIAAFADGECRGSARLMYVAPINRYVAFLTIVGDEASELRFSLYDSETGVVETQGFASLRYETNATMGSLETPYVIRFRSTTGMDEWTDNLNIFPNPVNRGERFSLGMTDDMKGRVQVEIVNALGMVVETQNLASPQSITAPMVAGVYTLRITVGGKGTCYRKLVVR